ncbi:Bisdemethoxycurcumin synthase [Zea mays]|uniref:Bisdemethoxycurcumin synthase n=1 Tax=Zea mays TaxID=4577 RepID=A0A3L6FMH6_MAIZE|nr:Bisdemethoxycurcumin synthase [Zea mays]
MTSLLLGSQIARPAVGLCSDRRRELRADGPATVLAIGTANPPNCVRQEEYADYYFRVTKSEHLTSLKDKLKRICHKSAIKKRYFHHTEELLRGHPAFIDRSMPSLHERQDIMASAVPELAAAAAVDAIAEWGRPATEITHLVVTTYSGAHMPGVDWLVASLLGLRPTVRRTMLYMNGCSSGCAALRLAKDMAENNRGARVLVLQSLFGDGAGAVIVGADPVSVEEPDFEMLSASQTMIPESKHVAAGQLCEDGLHFHPSREIPSLVRENIEQCMVDALSLLGIGGSWNDLFWAVHPGGRAVLDSVEAGLRLEPHKLEASRRVLSEYGNMSGPSVIFVLDELRRQQERKGMGVILGLGPGVSVETMVLQATDNQKKI